MAEALATIDPDGSVLIPLDDDEVRAQVRRLKEANVEAVAVCLLFSFLHPEHEARIGAALRKAGFEAALFGRDIHVLTRDTRGTTARAKRTRRFVELNLAVREAILKITMNLILLIFCDFFNFIHSSKLS